MDTEEEFCHAHDAQCEGRRMLLKSAAGLAALGMIGGVGLVVPDAALAAAMTKQQRDKLTPGQVIESLKQGNERFRRGEMLPDDYLAQKRASAAAQYPSAAILSCIDSRAPAEILLDTGIGEAFNARVAGNIVNGDLLGSLEFACALAGAKVIVVMGHTSCGAIKGAIDEAELGNLTGLLRRIRPAVDGTQYAGDRSSKNEAFVDAVAVTNVRRTLDDIRRDSQVLGKLEQEGTLKIVGAMYHLVGGRVEFLD